MQINNVKSLVEAFEPGDLLFGLENEARALFYQDLKSKLQSMGSKYDFITIDEIVKPLESYYLYGEMDEPDPLERQLSPIRNHGRLWVDSPEYLAIENHPSSPSSKERQKILLSDKIAIDNARGKIHFCLDGFDPSHQTESFTLDELRHIALNFQSLRHKVIFYRNGMPVVSPWDEKNITPEDWLKNQCIARPQVPRDNHAIATKRIKLVFEDEPTGASLSLDSEVVCALYN